jgi:glutathione S-transferase
MKILENILNMAILTILFAIHAASLATAIVPIRTSTIEIYEDDAACLKYVCASNKFDKVKDTCIFYDTGRYILKPCHEKLCSSGVCDSQILAGEKGCTDDLQIKNMSEITLHYFDCYARGETVRIIFAYAGVEYTDHRVSDEEWINLKANNFTEFGQLPALDIDGERLVQSHSIVRYVGQKYGFYPSDIKESYQVESICDLKEDIYLGLVPNIYNINPEGVEKFITESAPRVLGYLNKRLEKNHGGEGFFVGDRITIADFEVFQIVYDYFLVPNYKEKYEHLVDAHAPKVKALIHRIIESSPALKAYLENRPESPF